MTLRIKTTAFLLLLACSYSYGQKQQYNNRRELKGISEQWHKVVLPDEIFGKVSQNLSDIRIFGITPSKDTVEAPYSLRLLTEKVIRKEIAFKTLNISQNNRGYFFTFEILTTEPINQLNLKFNQQNFDWQLKLEGSQDQQEWFTVIDNYRILSIKNELTDFQFAKLTFPNSKYRFFRLFIDSKEKPDLTIASIVQHEITKGSFKKYPIRISNTKENKQTGETEIDIELQLAVPISYIKIDVDDSFDYYRPITIQYLADSIKTEQGWKYIYHTLTSGVLNSLEENEFKISSRTVQKLKILIHNKNNQPLALGQITIKGYVHELVTRFTEPATYFLTYGNENVGNPHYDIDRFTDKIPETLLALELGEELTIEKVGASSASPLFKNKIWLWIVMTIMISLLGWFSIRMIRKK